jgi:hypothetical protein
MVISGRILGMEGVIAVFARAVAADGQLERVSELTYQRLLAVAGNRPKHRRVACFLSASGSHKEALRRIAGGAGISHPGLSLVRHTTRRAWAN